MLKIGELAKGTGITIRTLHHYDQMGLVSPSERSKNGHRLYTPRDVFRLNAVRMLQQLGISLSEIKRILSHKDFSLPKLTRLYISLLVKRVRLEESLANELEAIYKIWESENETTIESVVQCIKAMNDLQEFGSNIGISK